MKKVLLPLIAVAFLFAACKKNSEDGMVQANQQQQSQLSAQPVLTTQQINAFIHQTLDLKGEFNWKDASDFMLYSAIMRSDDHMVSVGFKPANEQNVDERLAKINIHDTKWAATKVRVMQLILQEEKTLHPQMKLADVEVWKENKLPVIDVKIESLTTIKLLRKSNLIRYVEPMGYEPGKYELTAKTNSSGDGNSGCGGYDGNTSLKEGLDYTTIMPSTKRSWNYAYHGIPAAWTKSTGAGIKIMVIDTGLSPDQENMGSDFNQGYSSGRTIQTMYTLPHATSAADNCGHGTTMSSTIAAPRGIDGNSCGVAYNCSLVVCKATHDVIIDGSDEVKGVSDAYTFAADDPTIKITSMSVGRLTSSSQIKDAIVYAYGKGKMMFCAGGTSTAFTKFVGVIFPATLPQVEAITGVKDKTTLAACYDCHKGKAIDFVIVMQRISDGGNPIANAISGDVPTTVGGSSVATATSAGIAALVWSKYPGETRDQILQRLTTTASLYPAKNKSFGYGKLNADLATN
jgi:subtilisin family serine protease